VKVVLYESLGTNREHHSFWFLC